MTLDRVELAAVVFVTAGLSFLATLLLLEMSPA